MVTLDTDPFTVDCLALGERNAFDPLVRQNWRHVHTRFNRGRLLHNIYNFRTDSTSVESLKRFLETIFWDPKLCFCLNLSFGCIVRHVEMGEGRYFRNSNLGTFAVFDRPWRVADRRHLEQKGGGPSDVDLEDQMKRRRSGTEWALHKVTNVTLYVGNIKDHPIGCGHDLPANVAHCRSP